MKIKSVAVLGAGAVGSYVIWGLSEKSDIRLGVIAEGERAERLKKNGCAINGKTYHPEVWTPDEAHDVDLMVIGCFEIRFTGRCFGEYTKSNRRAYGDHESDERC